MQHQPPFKGTADSCPRMIGRSCFAHGPVHQYQSADQATSACFLFQRATVCGDILDLDFDLDDVLLGLLAES